MNRMHLFADTSRIERIKEYLHVYPWYKESFENIKGMCDEMIEKGFYVPKEKGYVFNEACRAHNALMIFNPYDEHSFMCPVCKLNYKDEPYKRARVTAYHSWLSQMMIYLGISYQITKDDSYTAAGKKILTEYSVNYDMYPNKDNEIGTTKIFQSTFVEAIWLTHMCVGYDLLNESTVFSRKDRKKCMQLFTKSAYIIKDYNEKKNNRQAFNNCGMCAAAILTGDDKLLDHVLNGQYGFYEHMKNSVLDDGLWYEGDNYHFATVPSLVNIAVMCGYNEMDLFGGVFNGNSIKDMFYAPLKSLQPDATFPSRKDSPYANSASNRWLAGLYEVAYGVYGDDDFGAFLNYIYDTKPDKSICLTSAAGIMEIRPAGYASRQDMDWRAFLWCNPDKPQKKSPGVSTSVNMTGTGLMVLRRNDSYISIDYGNYGGGHGHPDRLALTCFLGGNRWFSDYGTGNYYLDHLRYYRSTLGHNTINQDGKRQLIVSGRYNLFYKGEMFDAGGGYIESLYPKTDALRMVCLFDNDIVFDFIKITSDREHLFHNVYHGFGNLNDKEYKVSEKLTPPFFEEGYDFLHDIKSMNGNIGHIDVFTTDKSSLFMHSYENQDTVRYSAQAYGPPKMIPGLFPVLIYEKKGSQAIFAHLYEQADHEACKKIEYFIGVDDENFEVGLRDKTLVKICVKEGISVTKIQDGIETVESAEFIESIEPDIKLMYETFIDFSKACENPFCIQVKNTSHTTKKALLFDEYFDIPAKSQKVFKYHIDHEGIKIENGYVYAKFNDEEKPFSNKLIKVDKYTGNTPVNETDLSDTIFIDEKVHIARAERHWAGVDDLSARGNIFTLNDHSLVINLKVRDDVVLFSGGKYDYDNDNVSIYFDRTPFSGVKTQIHSGDVYSLLLKGETAGMVSKAIPVSGNIKNVMEISLSMNVTSYGYDVCIVIPFECIGGKPEKGDLWGFDVIISDRDSGMRRELMAYWSETQPDERIYMKGEEGHEPERYGLILF